MSIFVLEIQQADYRELKAEQAQTLGQSLAVENDVLAVWITEDGSPDLRGTARLQFAVSDDDTAAAARKIWPKLEQMQREHGLKLAVVHFARKRPDVVPQIVADLLGIDVTPNCSRMISVLKRPSR